MHGPIAAWLIAIKIVGDSFVLGAFRRLIRWHDARRLIRWRGAKRSAKAFETLEKIRLIRSFQAMEDLLQNYEAKVLPAEHRSEPLKFVRERLRQTGDCSKDIYAALEQQLRGVLETEPFWSEYLLELGYLLVDQGRHEDAQKIFEMAGKGKPYMNSSAENMDPRAAGFFASGRLLVRQGNHEEAAKMFAEALKHDTENGTYNLERGLALWQLGKGQEAARHFFFSMRYTPVPYSLPKLTRDAATLDFPHLLPELKRQRLNKVGPVEYSKISSKHTY